MKFTILTAIAVSVSMVHAQEVEKKNTDRLEPSSKVVEKIAASKVSRVKAEVEVSNEDVKESMGNVIALKKSLNKSAGEAGLKVKGPVSTKEEIEAKIKDDGRSSSSNKQHQLNEVLKACAADAKSRMKDRLETEAEQGTQCLSEMESKRKGSLVRELALYCLEQKKFDDLSDKQIAARMDVKFKESYGKVFRNECLDREVNAFHQNGGKKRVIAAKDPNPAPTIERKEKRPLVAVQPKLKFAPKSTPAPKTSKVEVDEQEANSETYDTQAAVNEDGAEAAN